MNSAEVDTDRKLALRAKGGELRAFEILVERYKRHAYFIAYGFVGDRETALDLSQEAFAKAYKAIGKFNPDFRFFTWFYKILSNLCINHLQKRRLRREHEVRLEELPFEVATSDSDPALAYERKELNRRVWEAVQNLPPDFKEIIILRHFRDLSYRELAEILEIPIGSVMSRLHYARMKLKQELSDLV
jgi:RNA polymerase sigma-70 factor (ECF subfamily)